jgi:outer membrane protein OmpA-like peptidoglycan-associated protein
MYDLKGWLPDEIADDVPHRRAPTPCGNLGYDGQGFRDGRVGTVIKQYELPPGTSGLEEEKVHEKALKAAGWTITDVNDAVTTGDPNLTAHYAKGPIDLWVHVHAGGKLQVADAGAERASNKLKAELDKKCKVAIYGVNFDFDKATLRPDASPALDSILKLLTDYKDLQVELGGHTDKRRRARLQPEALGTLVPNDSRENQARNRRVELKKVDCGK